MKDYKKRFEDAPWVTETPIRASVYGCGGIGSWTSLFLSRAGFALTLVDDDIIEEVNLAGQFYKISDIQLLKSRAMADHCLKFSGNRHISSVELRIEEDFLNHDLTLDLTSPIWVSAFDNMKARKILFEGWTKVAEPMTVWSKDNSVPDKKLEGVITPIFIDGRLTAETFQVYAVTNEKDYKKFTSTLFSDDEVADLPCSFKSTSHCASMIGSIITSIITNHITNCIQKKNIREVPFYTEASIPLLMLNTEP